MHSCLYSGFVRHRRFTPVANEFQYSMFQLYLDLDELPQVFDPFPLWSARRPAIAWFRREDHLGNRAQPLRESVQDEIERQTGTRPNGPIRLLTNLRYFGYVINPVSYFYCFDRSSGQLETVLAEVRNTPWGERHCYVVSAPVSPDRGTLQTRWNDKVFHVSPFMNMSMKYRWQITRPGRRLAIHIENHERTPDAEATLREPHSEDHTTTGKDAIGAKNAASCRPPFDVTMSLTREELTASSLRRALLRHPCMTAKVASAIYWQALRLWWKGVPFVPHPRTKQPLPTQPEAVSVSAHVSDT